MQQKPPSINRAIIDNLMWFVGCLLLAFFVWVIATSQLDPVEQYRLSERVPIQLSPDSGLIITNLDAVTKSAQVVVRSPSSVRNLLVADDIVVWADLKGLGPGMHTVELQWEVAPERRAHVIDISPRQVTVNLEEQLSILVPVRASLIGGLPYGYVQQGDPTFDVNQVTVTGPTSRVQQVAAARVEVSLNGQRASIEDDVRPVAVDADGNVVQGVTVDTQVIRVKVPVGESTQFSSPTPNQP